VAVCDHYSNGNFPITVTEATTPGPSPHLQRTLMPSSRSPCPPSHIAPAITTTSSRMRGLACARFGHTPSSDDPMSKSGRRATLNRRPRYIGDVVTELFLPLCLPRPPSYAQSFLMAASSVSSTLVGSSDVFYGFWQSTDVFAIRACGHSKRVLVYKSIRRRPRDYSLQFALSRSHGAFTDVVFFYFTFKETQSKCR
jgi:hypothetical protein